MENTVLYLYLRLANIELERIIEQEQNLDDDERNEISTYIQEVWDTYDKLVELTNPTQSSEDKETSCESYLSRSELITLTISGNTTLNVLLILIKNEMQRMIRCKQFLNFEESNTEVIDGFIRLVNNTEPLQNYLLKIDPEHQAHLEELRLEAAEDYYGILNNPEINDDLDLDQQIQQSENL